MSRNKWYISSNVLKYMSTKTVKALRNDMYNLTPPTDEKEEFQEFLDILQEVYESGK